MATGSHGENHTDVHGLKPAQPHHFLTEMLHSGDEKKMREVDCLLKDDTDQERFPVGRCVHRYSRGKRGGGSKKKTRHCRVGAGAGRRTSDRTNKENEVTPSDRQAVLYSDSCGFTLNSSHTSVMAGDAFKSSDCFSELSQEHEEMMHVLFARNLRLNVALTLWRRNVSELVAYLNRIQDTGVLVDCLSELTKSLQEEQTYVSIGCCIDLLPQVKVIFNSRYEDHIITALLWLQSVLKKWWPEFCTNKSMNDGCVNDSRNVQAMKSSLLELWEELNRFISVPGAVGETAKVIESYLSQMR